MTEFFAQPDDFGEPRASELHSSLGERLGAQASEAVFSGSRTLFRLGQYAIAGGDMVPGLNMPEEPSPQDVGLMQQIKAEIPDVSMTDAKARLKQEGLDQHVKLPEQPSIRQPVLDLMIAHGHERRDYEAAVSRGPQGFIPDALGLVTSLGAGLIDPVNLAAFSIPVLGEARMGMLMARAGDSLISRAGVRAGIGAGQGAVGGAVLAPPDWWLHTRDGQDYTMADALHSVIMSAGMGAAFHAGFGGFGDVRARAKGRPLPGSPEDLVERGLLAKPQVLTQPEELGGLRPDEVPGISAAEEIAQAASASPTAALERSVHQDALEQLRSAGVPDEEAQANAAVATDEQIAAAHVRHPAEILADLPPRAQEDVVRAAIADVISDRPVRVGEMLNIAAGADPRIAESVHGPQAPSATVYRGPKAARGPRAKDPEHYTLLEFLALAGGLRPDPELAVIFGGQPKFIPGFGPLLRKNGMSLDHAREAAAEAGYIFDAGAVEGRQTTSTVEELRQLIDQEARGNRVYRYDRTPPESKAHAAARDEELRIYREREFDGALEDAGIDRQTVPDKTRARVLQIMDKEHVSDPLMAYEQAVMEESHYGQDIGQGGRTEEHIPGWDVPNESGAAPGGRTAIAEVGADGARGPARQPGAGDRGADWRSLADQRSAADDPTAVAESKEAAATPEPASIDAEKAPSAAEAAAKDADALLADMKPKLSEEEWRSLEDALNAVEQDKTAREQIARDGAACLAAAMVA